MSYLACRLPNHIGDCCMALPALRLLAQSHFTPLLVGKPWSQSLFRGMFWPSVAITQQMIPSGMRLRDSLSKYQVKDGLLFPNSLSSALLFRIARLRPTGFPTDCRGLFLSHSIPEPKEMHEVERFFYLAHEAILALGGTPAWDKVPKTLGLQLLEAHHEVARNILKKHLDNRSFALLAPVAKGLHHGQKKSWDHFNALCTPLRQMGIEPVVLPSPDEVQAARQACPDALFLPSVSLGVFAALATRAQFVIANDSGVSHIAAAVNAPQITLIGVTKTNRTGPWNPKAHCLGSIETGWPSIDTVLETIHSIVHHA